MLRMNSDRKPFTQQLTEVQKQFVSQENNIDPTKNGTPANVLTAMLNSWLMKQKRDAEEAELRLPVSYTHLDVYKRQGEFQIDLANLVAKHTPRITVCQYNISTEFGVYPHLIV